MMGRIVRGVGANAYSQGATVAIQLISVPGFIHAWGPSRFGLWLTLSAAATALSLTDAGVTIVTGNAMTMAVARGDGAGAGRMFGRNLRLVSLVVLGFGLLLAAGGAMTRLPNTWSAAADNEVRAAAALLGVFALLGLFLSLFHAGFRANGDYAPGLGVLSTIRIAEAGAALAIAASGGGLARAAAAQVVLRAAGVLVMAVLLRRRAPWVRFEPLPTPWREIRPLIGPALAALAIPAGLAVSLQGFTVVVGLAVSSGAVAVFVATRTLTRTLVQALGLFNHALMPEMAMAAGRDDPARAQALLRLNFLLGLATLVPGWVLLVLFGPTLMTWWTGGAIAAPPLVFALMATAALCHGAWMSSANLLLAVNRQAEYAFLFVLVALTSCLAALPLGGALGLAGVALASLAGEAVMAAWVVPPQWRDAVARADAGQAREAEA